MGSWHQDKRPVTLFDSDKWTVMCEGHITTLARFSTAEEAEAYLEALKRNGNGRGCYVLDPSGLTTGAKPC